MSTQMKLLISGVLAGLCLFVMGTAPVRAAGQQGMVVVRDPQTGQMRAPTPDELKALRARTPAPASLQGALPARPAVTTRTDGSHGVRLGDKSLVYEIVSRDAEGNLTSQCVQGDDAARAATTKDAHNDKEHNHDAR
jgi:hypothetical protein